MYGEVATRNGANKFHQFITSSHPLFSCGERDRCHDVRSTRARRPPGISLFPVFRYTHTPPPTYTCRRTHNSLSWRRSTLLNIRNTQKRTTHVLLPVFFLPIKKAPPLHLFFIILPSLRLQPELLRPLLRAGAAGGRVVMLQRGRYSKQSFKSF